MFKSIEYKLVAFIILLIASTCLLTIFVMHEEIWYAIFFMILIILSLCHLWINYRKFNQNILFLLNALDNGDYSFHFTESKMSRREKELNQLMNRIKDILVRARKEVIENEKFLSLIIESVSTGIVLLDDRNNVQATNSVTNKLLGLPVFTHLDQLKNIDESYPDLFANLQPSENAQLTINNEREEVQLILQVSKITLRKGTMRIITLSNIGNELEAKEMESWIRLIRVMTHEIMNSIAPITSLSETLLFAYKHNEEISHEDYLVRNTIDALETINSTGKGLISFVESYRRFTGVPKPQITSIELVPLLQNILRLESPLLIEKNIEASINSNNEALTINADESQITQVLVNLVKNATESIQSDRGGIIKINVTQNEGKTCIDICNNGEPVPADVAPHIFIPFFTTKEGGSGIGLSVSRYIMRLHGGNLKHHTTPNGSTVFSMIF